MGEVSAIILRDWLSFQTGTKIPIDVPGVVGPARSQSMPLVQDVSFGWAFQFASPGAVDVLIEMENSNVRPATEKAADPEWVVPDVAPSIITIIDTDLHIIAFNPVVTRFSRLLLTGQGVNDPGTQLVRAEMTYVRV